MKPGVHWGLLALGLVASILVTVGLWVLTGSFYAFFLAVPFLFAFPLSRPRREVGGMHGPGARLVARTCPECGRAAADAEARFCAYDGTPLPA